MSSDLEEKIQNMKLEKKGNYYNILINEAPIHLTLPKMKIPFGIDQIGNDHVFKLSLFKIRENLEYQRCINYIYSLEKKLGELLETDTLKSNIYSHPKYDPTIAIKIPSSRGNNISTDIFDSDNTPLSLFDLQKGDNVVCDVVIDTIWVGRGKFNYKIKAKKIKKCV